MPRPLLPLPPTVPLRPSPPLSADLSGLRGMLDVAEEEEEGVLGLEEEGEEEEWEVDDEKILQAQREMQQKNQQLEVGGP